MTRPDHRIVRAASLRPVTPGERRGWSSAADRGRADAILVFDASGSMASTDPSGNVSRALIAFAARLREAGKAPKVVVIAVARKLFTALDAMIRTEQPWAPQSA